MEEKTYSIHVINNPPFRCKESETILHAAIRHKVKIPVGCKGGACGICKIKIIDGEVEIGICSKKALTEGEILEGFALACQATPKSDLICEVSNVNERGWLKAKA